MTREEHLRALIGDLALTVATFAAENDALRAQLAAASPPPAAAVAEDPAP